MNLISYLRSLGARFLHRCRTEKELEEELSQHIQLRSKDLERSGFAPAEAERQARIEFGSNERFKAECREAMAGNFLDTLLQDLRFTVRILAKSPGFTAVIILTMAVAIGATTAIFSVVDATLLHPLPYPDAGQLVQIVDDLPASGRKTSVYPYRNGKISKAPAFSNTSHRSAVVTSISPACLSRRGSRFSMCRQIILHCLALNRSWVARLIRTIRRRDLHWRLSLSDRLWKEAFGSDPQILGKKLRLDNDLYRVIGVMPPGFHDPLRTIQQRNTQLWAASGFAAPPAPAPLRSSRFIPEAIGRLKSGLEFTRGTEPAGCACRRVAQAISDRLSNGKQLDGATGTIERECAWQ